MLNLAASNSTGVSDFNYVMSNPSYSGLKKRDYDNPREKDTTIRVKTDLLDNVIPKDISIDLIKIDVEGAELQVLEGAIEIIEKNKPIIIFEHGIGASNHYGTTPAKLFDFFSKVSMKVSTLDNYLTNKKPLTKSEFEKQYYDRLNYYFIAHK
ncbi:MAG: FkbM family methyltransferase [Flavobacteriales bacterium]|nr:FkbM family methyltransferase [Flavobacteriales bacterium]